MQIDRIAIAGAHSAPLVEQRSVAAIAAAGLEGDRHFGNNARHVSIQSREELALASERLGRTIEPDLTRRNITLQAGLLPRKRGLRFAVGDAVLEVFADAAPCALMEELNGPGARVAMKRLAGIHCRIVTSGQISVGDLLVPVESQPISPRQSDERPSR